MFHNSSRLHRWIISEGFCSVWHLSNAPDVTIFIFFHLYSLWVFSPLLPGPIAGNQSQTYVKAGVVSVKLNPLSQCLNRGLSLEAHRWFKAVCSHGWCLWPWLRSAGVPDSQGCCWKWSLDSPEAIAQHAVTPWKLCYSDSHLHQTTAAEIRCVISPDLWLCRCMPMSVVEGWKWKYPTS